MKTDHAKSSAGQECIVLESIANIASMDAPNAAMIKPVRDALRGMNQLRTAHAQLAVARSTVMDNTSAGMIVEHTLILETSAFSASWDMVWRAASAMSARTAGVMAPHLAHHTHLSVAA